MADARETPRVERLFIQRFGLAEPTLGVAYMQQNLLHSWLLERSDPMTTERERLFAIAHALGHTDPMVWETSGGRFFSTCSCGWESTTRVMFVDALGAGVSHALGVARPVARKAARAGRPLGVLIAAEKAKGPQLRPHQLNQRPRERFRRAA